MAFGIGVAIADLFARIAAALRSGGGSSIGPLPPRPPSPPRPPTDPVPPRPGPVPEPPYVPPPPPPPVPPPVVVVPPSPPVIPNGGGGVDCSTLSLSDRMALYGLQQRAAEEEVQQYLSPRVIIPEVEDVSSAINTGTIIEATDYFRFRALSTSDNVEVTFFGRVINAANSITHFGQRLQTVAPNTVYEMVVPAGRGVLLGAAASVAIGSITAGSVSAVGEVGRIVNGGFVPHTLLFSGQLDDLTPLTASSASVSAPVGRPTFRNDATVTVGADFTQLDLTPSAGKRARVLAVAGDWTTSAVAGNRLLFTRIGTTAFYVWRGHASRYIGPSTNGVNRSAINQQMDTESTNLPGAFREVVIPLPGDLYFYEPIRIQLAAYGPAGAGDTPTATPVVTWEES